MSKKNIVHILEKFKANTDANATNQGFYYQYLITLDNWLDNYVNKNDVVIYCETEDDIKAENVKDNNLRFTQVKAYSTDFSIKSNEIKKAIINFFYLDIAYKDNTENLQFIFHTNSNFKDDFFEKDLVEVDSILNEHYVKKFEEAIKEHQKKIEESEEYLNKYPKPKQNQKNKYEGHIKQLSNSKSKTTQYKDELQEVKQYIQQELFQFIKKIQWEPLKKEKENAIEYVIESILEKIDRIDGFKLDVDSAYAHLIKKVVVASQSRNIEDRKLDNRVIDKIIEEFQSIDKFKNSLQNIQMLSTFHNIFNEQKSQTKLLKNIDESVNAVINYDELRERLKYKYQTFEKLPLLLDEKKQNNVSDLIINLETIKENNQNKEKKEEKETIQIDTLLERLNKTPKLLIYGDAGIGKTTLCKYIAYKWAKDKLTQFDYVIYLPLRVWESKGLAGAIKDYYYHEEENRSFEFIDNIENDSQDILFLFDGYDELNEKKKSDLKQNHLSKLKNYIIVSRPTGYNENEFNIDKVYKSIGYLPNDISEYIDKFFDVYQQNSDLNHFLEQNNSIAYLAHIPLMLEIICVLWKQKKSKLSDSMTMTELYSEVVESILAKHFEQDRNVSTCLKKTRIKYELGKLAFDGLKQQKILFDCNFLAKVVDYNTIEFFETHVIKSGFLKPENTPIEFLHLTFQEYFAAYYVNTLSPYEQREIIKEYKFYPHMQMFFSFLAGLIEDKEFLLGEIESEPRDILGYYETIFILDIISEINKNKLNEVRIKSINNDFIYWTTHTLFYYGDKHQVILKKLKGVKQCISKKTIDAIVPIYKNFIKEEEIDSWYRGKAVEALVYFDKNDNIFIKELEDLKSDLNQNVNDNKYVQGKISKVINLITKKNTRVVQKHFHSSINNDIDFKLKEKVFKLLSFSEKEYNENLTTLVNLIKSESNKNEVVNSLFLFDRKDDEFILLLLKLLENQTINFYSRKIIAGLLSSLNRSDSKFVKMIIKFIKVETIDSEIRAIVASSLVYKESNGNKVVNALIKFIHNTFDEVAKGRVAISLASLGRSDNKVVNPIVKFIKNDTTDSWIKVDVVIALAKLFSENISIFRKIDITEYYPILFVKEISIESFFEAYDNNYIRFGYINSSMIIENAIYNKLPLYIRDNKLHTIKNGQEVSTKRDVDKEFLIELNSLLVGFDEEL